MLPYLATSCSRGCQTPAQRAAEHIEEEDRILLVQGETEEGVARSSETKRRRKSIHTSLSLPLAHTDSLAFAPGRLTFASSIAEEMTQSPKLAMGDHNCENRGGCDGALLPLRRHRRYTRPSTIIASLMLSLLGLQGALAQPGSKGEFSVFSFP